MEVPAAARRIAEAVPELRGRLYLVGGCVRDLALGSVAKNDLDLVTTVDAPALAEALWQAGVSAIPPVTYPRFGTAMVMVDGVQVELVTARRESYDETSRKPNVAPASLEEDAARRDFTVNTLLLDPYTGELHDVLGKGIQDLQAKVLRTPDDPVLTLRDDPLRSLRAVRFRHQLGFEIDAALMSAIRQEAGRLAIVSHERIRDELNKIMDLASADEAWQDLLDYGLLGRFAPELAEMVGVTQGDYHDADVWHHSRRALRNTAGQPRWIRWATWLHDIGKPRTRSVEKGRIRFFGHEKVGAEMAADLLDRLKFSRQEAAPIVTLVRHHMRFMGVPKITPAVARRLVRDLGDLIEPLLTLCDADAGALKSGVRRFDPETVRQAVAALGPVAAKNNFDSPLTGEEIMQLVNIPAGPVVGRLKRWLSDLVVNGDIPAGDRESATERLTAAKGNATEWKRITSEGATDAR